MEANGIGLLDVCDALSRCSIIEMELLGSIARYWALGEDGDGRWLEVLFVLGDELTVIEIISVKVDRS